MSNTQYNTKDVEDIIRKTLTKMFSETAHMPFFADDSHLGTGKTHKYHFTSEYNAIWPFVLEDLHNDGQTEWKMSNSMDYTNSEKPVPAKWIGIRNARLPRKRKSYGNKK
jgi:hypothetical protein